MSASWGRAPSGPEPATPSRLLLHGFTGSPRSFEPLELPPGSLSPALAGHAGAPPAAGFWDEVERLSELGRGCRRLLGYSLGGRLALGILARHPERFEHALLIGARLGLVSELDRAERRADDARFARQLREQGLSAFVRSWETQPLWQSQAELPEALLARQRELRLTHDAEALAGCLERLGLAEMPELRPQLARVKCPVELLVGERDPKFLALANELCGIIPGARLTIADGAGHNLLLERPALCAARLLQGTKA